MIHYLLEHFSNNPIRTTNGSDVIRVSHPNHGMHGIKQMLQFQV